MKKKMKKALSCTVLYRTLVSASGDKTQEARRRDKAKRRQGKEKTRQREDKASRICVGLHSFYVWNSRLLEVKKAKGKSKDRYAVCIASYERPFLVASSSGSIPRVDLFDCSSPTLVFSNPTFALSIPIVFREATHLHYTHHNHTRSSFFGLPLSIASSLTKMPLDPKS
jgi:hypothetical protein